MSKPTGNPMFDEELSQWRALADTLKESLPVSVPVFRNDVEAIERLSDAAVRAGAYETAVEGYALALRLRSETGFHPLRRADDEPST